MGCGQQGGGKNKGDTYDVLVVVEAEGILDNSILVLLDFVCVQTPLLDLGKVPGDNVTTSRGDNGRFVRIRARVEAAWRDEKRLRLDSGTHRAGLKLTCMFM